MSRRVADRAALGRKALAEFLGTALLVTAIIGSGIAAQRLSPGDVGLQLLENTVATAAALAALLLALGPVSGAHINPVITLVDRVFGGISSVDAAAYIAAQLLGGTAGALVANTMFGEAAISLSTKQRSSGPHLFGEVIATFGLVVVVFGIARSGRSQITPFAVAAYIAAAYWFTSSTSFANPAVTLGRMLSNSFAGIAPESVGPFVLFELVGGALGAGCVALLYPRVRRSVADVDVSEREIA